MNIGLEICSIPISIGYQMLKLDTGHRISTEILNKFCAPQIQYFSVVYESFIKMS